MGGLAAGCSSALTPARWRLRRRLLFRPHPSAVAAAPRLLSRPHPNPLPHGRGGRTAALTPALSLAGEGVRGGRLAPPVLFRPHPSPLPRGRGGKRRSRPHPSPLPRGRGGRRWWAACAAGCSSALTPALSLAGEGVGPSPQVVGGCAAVALPPSPQPSPSRARGPDCRPHAGALPRGRGGKRWAACAAGCSSALTPALSLAGEGVRDGAALTPALSLTGEGVRGGGRLCRRLLFRPHPSAVPRGRGSRTSALTPTLSLTGEGAGLPPSPQPSPSRARGPGGGWAPGVCGGGGGWWAACAAGCSSALTPALSLTGEGVRGGGRLRRRFSSALTPALSLAGEGAGLPPSPRRCPSRERGPRGGWLPGVCGGGVDGGRLRRRLLFRPHPSPLPHGRGGRTSALTPALSLAGEGARLPLPLRSVAFLCYSYVVSHARGHIVLCLRHPYITHGPS